MSCTKLDALLQGEGEDAVRPLRGYVLTSFSCWLKGTHLS